ncbi:MAG TPA: GGDEF domain-containing protein [Egibacteraceae bacterium]
MKVLAVDDHEVEFWIRHTWTGVVLTVAVIVTVLVYGTVTRAPNRGLMFGLVLSIGAATPGIFLLPLRRIVRHPLGALFFYAWEALGIVAIALVGVLDGGGFTPISILYFMILVHGATAYPPMGVCVAGLMVSGAYLFVALSGDGVHPGVLTCMIATIVVVTATAAWASANYRRVTQQKAALALQLAALADRDGLTGCLNHRAFHERLHAEAARAARHGHPLALLLIDLDDFKGVNDQRGHPAGDAVLVRVSEALHQTARESDAVGRIGGDEFALLLPETTAADAMRVAERVCTTIRSIEEPAPVTVSIGVGALEDVVDAQTLLAQADVAVYQAKREGRDGACAYDPNAPTTGGDGPPHARLLPRTA